MDSDGNGKISENGDGGKLLMEGCSKSSKVQLVLVSFRWYGMVWYGMVWYGIVEFNVPLDIV